MLHRHVHGPIGSWQLFIWCSHFLGDSRFLTRWQMRATMICVVSEPALYGSWRSEMKYLYLHREHLSQWTIYQDYIHVLINLWTKATWIYVCENICCLYNKKITLQNLTYEEDIKSVWKTIKKTSVQKCEMQSFNWEEYVLSVIFGVYAFVSFSTFTVCYEYFSHFMQWLSHLFLNNSYITSWKATCQCLWKLQDPHKLDPP